MPSTLSPSPSGVLLLATGGTIAGRVLAQGQGYTAGVLTPQDLLRGLALPPAVRVQAEAVAQLDSKDMDGEVWSRLVVRAGDAMAQDDVCGLVVTHGTDTMEETAYLLARLLPACKPVVLTGAMRPADAPDADGPDHLRYALSVAAHGAPAGVWVAMNGRLHAPGALRKLHGQRLLAFDSPEPVKLPPVLPASVVPPPGQPWPWVEILESHADARAETVEALVRAGVRGLVVAGTGGGTVHRRLLGALQSAADHGVAVWWASRCAFGGLAPGRQDGGRLSGPQRPPGLEGLAAPALRVELSLALLATGLAGAARPAQA